MPCGVCAEQVPGAQHQLHPAAAVPPRPQLPPGSLPGLRAGERAPTPRRCARLERLGTPVKALPCPSCDGSLLRSFPAQSSQSPPHMCINGIIRRCVLQLQSRACIDIT